MNKSILAVTRCSLMLLFPAGAYAISAQWDLDPISGDWNTAANWTPMAVPNGPADIATFGLSNTADVSISADTEVNGITFTAAATSPYTITANPGLTLTISGTGITNNSGTTQNFVTAAGANGAVGQIIFTNSATAGSSTIFTNNGGSAGAGGITEFHGSSLAGNGTFINKASTVVDVHGGATFFFDNSTASNATFINKGAAVIGGFDSNGVTVFENESTAANATFTNDGGAASGARGGVIEFHDSSSAANGTFINNGATAAGAEGGFTDFFFSSATAGNATFINNGGTVSDAGGGRTSVDGGTAGNGTFINNAATVSGAFGGSTSIVGTAANGTFINNGGTVSGAAGGFTQISDTAANATFTNNGATVSGAGGGFTQFDVDSTADSATLIANGGTGGGEGGSILFTDNSTGGTSRIEVFGNGNLDISLHGAGSVTVGSIEGDGNAFLGASNLTVGSNNLSTTFSGVIQDGGQNENVGGSLTKIGSGTLILSGANTYTGNTNVNGSVLQVDGSISSNTFVNHGGTLAGTGTVYGNVTNNNAGRVSPGDAPGVLTVVHNYTQTQYATLMIQIAGANAGQFSVLNVLGNANLNGYLDPVLLNGFVPTIGQSFIFLNYASLTGGFSRIQNQVFNNGTEQWSVIYQNNDAILTVGPNTIPDHGSTLLLLTLGLLSLVAYRRQLLAAQDLSQR
jgi:energy-converting hydrogenase Eha subunit E